jgi:hypothetical protein
MMNLRATDVGKVIGALPTPVFHILEASPENVLAGGFIRDTIIGETPNDIDIFTPDVEDLRHYLTGVGATELADTKNAITMRLPKGEVVQLVKGEQRTPGDIIRQFDFTMTQAAVWIQAGMASGIAAGSFYLDAKQRILRYANPPRHDVGLSVVRAFKFAARGYSIGEEEIASLLNALHAEAKVKGVSVGDLIVKANAYPALQAA